MQFETQSGGVIQFSKNVVEVFQAFRQLSNESKESGGVLLGRIILNDADLIVDRVSSPTKDDKATRFSFFRPIRLAQRYVVSAWIKSRGAQNYLGEWHTHPEDSPRPSGTDITNWQRIYRRSNVGTDELFFLIVGRRDTRTWSLNKNDRTPVELKRIRI